MPAGREFSAGLTVDRLTVARLTVARLTVARLTVARLTVARLVIATSCAAAALATGCVSALDEPQTDTQSPHDTRPETDRGPLPSDLGGRAWRADLPQTADLPLVPDLLALTDSALTDSALTDSALTDSALTDTVPTDLPAPTDTPAPLPDSNPTPTPDTAPSTDLAPTEDTTVPAWDTAAPSSDTAAPPADPCASADACANDPPIPVCYPLTTEAFPNVCLALCAHPEALPELVIFANSVCEAAACPNCNPNWKEGGPVCLAGAITYPSPWHACCAGHNWQSDPELSPGSCAAPQDCTAGCPQTGAPLCGIGPDGTYTDYVNSCTFMQCHAPEEILDCGAPCPAPPGEACEACAGLGCAPVCGTDGQTYRNSCGAGCAQTSVAYLQACCDCPPPNPTDWWCSKEGQTHGNLCELICKQESPDYPGPCVDGCVQEPEDPPEGVCGTLGSIVTLFPNQPCAEAAGAQCVYPGPCVPNPDVCKTTNTAYEPVCAAISGEDAPRSFANACHAACAGAHILSEGLCAPCANPICAAANVQAAQPFCGPRCVLYPNACVPTKCLGLPLSSLYKTSCPQNCPAP